MRPRNAPAEVCTTNSFMCDDNVFLDVSQKGTRVKIGKLIETGFLQVWSAMRQMRDADQALSPLIADFEVEMDLKCNRRILELIGGQSEAKYPVVSPQTSLALIYRRTEGMKG
ncbi:hypothetical protein TNCV_4209281 [Trichonephila clavipes]|nr:hypothetical protein TNCV_4209281 [Trichonephila clavipes]